MDWRKRAFEELRQVFPIGRGFSDPELDDISDLYGSSSGALMYASLFNPVFIEIDGLVLLSNNIYGHEIHEKVRQCKNDGWDKSEIEKSFNFLEVGYRFANRDSPEIIDEILAMSLIDTWSALLHYRFPSRSFSFELIPPKESGSIVSISFFQDR